MSKKARDDIDFLMKIHDLVKLEHFEMYDEIVIKLNEGGFIITAKRQPVKCVHCGGENYIKRHIYTHDLHLVKDSIYYCESCKNNAKKI